MAITKEQVADAAAAIQAEGLEPTYMNVRERLGSGSFSTIQKYLRDWRSSGAEIKPQAEELPEPFREVLQRFGLEAWRAVSVWAKDELEEARKDFERRVAENQAEAEKAAATVDALQGVTGGKLRSGARELVRRRPNSTDRKGGKSRDFRF